MSTVIRLITLDARLCMNLSINCMVKVWCCTVKFKLESILLSLLPFGYSAANSFGKVDITILTMNFGPLSGPITESAGTTAGTLLIHHNNSRQSKGLGSTNHELKLNLLMYIVHELYDCSSAVA